MKAIYRHGYDKDIVIEVVDTRCATFNGAEFTEVVCADGDILPSTWSEETQSGEIVYGCAENF